MRKKVALRNNFSDTLSVNEKTHILRVIGDIFQNHGSSLETHIFTVSDYTRLPINSFRVDELTSEDRNVAATGTGTPHPSSRAAYC